MLDAGWGMGWFNFLRARVLAGLISVLLANMGLCIQKCLGSPKYYRLLIIAKL